MTRKSFYFFILLSCIGNKAGAQTFEKILNYANYNGNAKLTMADLDNDGYPEVIYSSTDGFTIFKNNNGTFDEQLDYPQYRFNNHIFSIDVGDVNNDGWIDILQAAQNYNGYTPPAPFLLLNKGTSFEISSDNLIQSIASNGTLYLGDFEGDGDLDVISSAASGIMLNQKGKMLPGPSFPNSGTWYANWWNLDTDPELEVIQVEGNPGSGYVTGTKFLELSSSGLKLSSQFKFNAIQLADAVLADFDADGDLDMLIKIQGNTNTTRIFTNVNGQFSDSGIVFPWGESIDFADINNDGLYDVIISGMVENFPFYETGVYIKQINGSFTKLNVQIASFDHGRAAIGDFDGDGDLDIPSQNGFYRNDIGTINGIPTSPPSTNSAVSGSSVELSWQQGSDDSTPPLSLSYNVSVRSEDGSIIVPSHSLASGKRQIFKIGNAWNNSSFQLNCLKQGKYYWKVQTLDASYQGSTFSAEQSFTITKAPPVAPVNIIASPISDASISLTWTDQSTTEDEFIILRKPADSPIDFSQLTTVPANTTSFIDSVYLEPSTTYIYRVIASNCAYPDDFVTETLPVKTFPRAFVDSNWLNIGNAKGTMMLLGDYDNDADLDMLLSYSTSNQTKLFRFNGTKYEDSGIQFPLKALSAVWIDYNNDTYLDVIFDGGRLFKNESSGSFVEVPNPGFTISSFNAQAGITRGDCDNDGDEDLLSKDIIYKNDGKGHFTNSQITLSGYTKSLNALADYDMDGDLDILGNKEVSCSSHQIVIHENQNGNFIAVYFPTLEGINSDFLNHTGDMEWGDYDNDGYPDILVSGQSTCGNGYGITKIYHNNGNKSFSLKANLVRQIYDVNVDWGDYDNDGDLDVFMYGDPFSNLNKNTRVFKNDFGKFKETNINYLLASSQYGNAARGDIDGDGDLDYVILGEINYTTSKVTVYRNTYSEGWSRTNQRPSPPNSLSSAVESETVTLTWNYGQDAETATPGLTYNLYLIDETDSIIINSYSLTNGKRKIVATGNASSNNTITLKNIKPGTYRWAVQAIDQGYSGSIFSNEDTFVIQLVTGIEHEDLLFTMYPNPVEDNLIVTMDLAKSGIGSLVIVNTLGQHVLEIQATASETVIDMSGLAQGLYSVIHTSDSKLIGRVIKK